MELVLVGLATFLVGLGVGHMMFSPPEKTFLEIDMESQERMKQNRRM